MSRSVHSQYMHHAPRTSKNSNSQLHERQSNLHSDESTEILTRAYFTAWNKYESPYLKQVTKGDFTFWLSLLLSQFAERNLKLNAKVHT